jgi:hypothetical protein
LYRTIGQNSHGLVLLLRDVIQELDIDNLEYGQHQVLQCDVEGESDEDCSGHLARIQGLDATSKLRRKKRFRLRHRIVKYAMDYLVTHEDSEGYFLLFRKHCREVFF